MTNDLNDTFHVRRLFGRDQHAWDELLSVSGARLELRSGGLTVGAELAASARAVLTSPSPTGAFAHDAAEWARYVSGPWSPVRAARALLDLAASVGASDVHLEPGVDTVTIRFRMRGELVPFTTLRAPLADRLIAAIKAISGCLPYRRDLVQEGRVPRAGVTADVRASFIPTALGERVALRLFGRLLELDALGFPVEVLDGLDGALARQSGLIVIAGPSGAGKTTTLYAALARVVKRRPGAHLSLEDPVEQRLRVAGIAVDQVELAPERGLTGEAALVAALRQDVDVLSVGEVRTSEEASLALKAAHTGRLVLAGLHAGSVGEARQRLVDLGVDGRLLDQTLVAVLHQRLETVSCPDGSAACPACGGLGRTRRVVGDLWVAAASPVREVA